MIATVRGLLVQLVLALLLGVLVVVLAPSAPATVDRSLAPGLATESLAQLEIRRSGAPAIVITRGHGGWSLPGNVPANPSTIDALLTALRAGTWQRRAPAASAGAPRDQLVAGGLSLSLGQSLTGSDQIWLVRGSAALLVDGWIAHSLFPGALDLRIRQPLADAPGAKTITAGTVRLAGTHLLAPVEAWLDPGVVRDVTAALAELSIVSLDRGAQAPPTFSITVDGITVSDAGACSDHGVWITSSTGDGCVDAASWARARSVLETLAREPGRHVDPQPLPFTPAEVTLADRTVLTLGAQPRVGSDDADLDRVNELLAALATPGTVGALPPSRAASGLLRARDAAGHEVTLALLPDHKLQRDAEPVALVLPPAAWSVLRRSSDLFRDAVLWREDPTTISALTVDGIRYQRGAVLGEWARHPAGATDPALVDALVDALATVRGPTGEPPAQVAHRLTIMVTPPAGAPSTHTLELGAVAGQRCPARVDGKPVVLSLELCTAAFALASPPPVSSR